MKSKKILRKILFIFIIFLIFFLILVTSIFIYIAATAPDFDTSALYKSEPTTILDKNNEVITKIGVENRKIITYDEIPEVLINAIIATEDSRFFNHKGIDIPRFLKATFQHITGNPNGGASTITMQISKNIYTDTNTKGLKGLKRKLTDVYMSVFKIEPYYSKKNILEFYINSFYLGNCYGIELTSQLYFGKSAKDLNLSESALIAGLFQSPYGYNPLKYPGKAEQRRKTVLYLMKKHGYINDNEYKIALKMTVDKILNPHDIETMSTGIVNEDYQHFVDMVIEDVENDTGLNPYKNSMTIYTTMDPTIQKNISDITNGKTYEWLNKNTEVSIAVTNVNDGSIEAIVGGKNAKIAKSLNRAKYLNHEIGTLALPLYDYAPAIEYLNLNTGTLFKNNNSLNGDYSTLEQNIKNNNLFSAKTAFDKVSSEDKFNFANNLGLSVNKYSCPEKYILKDNNCYSKTNNEQINPNINEMSEKYYNGDYKGESPLSISSAYAAFANGGKYTKPYSYTKVKFNDDNKVYNKDIKSNKAMNESTAYMITYMLSKDNIVNLTSKIKYENNNKDSIKDIWLVAYNKNHSLALWNGYEGINNGLKDNDNEYLLLYNNISKYIFSNNDELKKPDDILTLEIEKNTANSLLASPNTPNDMKYKVLFKKGTEPKETSTKYEKLPNPKNVRLVKENNFYKVKWDIIDTPNAININYLNGMITNNTNIEPLSFKYANDIYFENMKELGSVVYYLYVKENNNLKLINMNSILNEITINSSYANKKLYLRAEYFKFKDNQSDLVEVKKN